MKRKLLVLALTSLLMLSGCGIKKPDNPPIDPPGPVDPTPTEATYSISVAGVPYTLTKVGSSTVEYQADLVNLKKNAQVVFKKDNKEITSSVQSEAETETNKNLFQRNGSKYYVHNDADTSKLTFKISDESYTFWATGYIAPEPVPEAVYSVSIGDTSIELTKSETETGKYSASLTNLLKDQTVVFKKNNENITRNIASEPQTSTNRNLIQGSVGNFSIHNDAASSTLTFTVGENDYCSFWATGFVDDPTPPEPGEYDVASYYDGYYLPIVSWEDGEDLMNQLHSLIRTGFHGITYDDPNWESNQYSEQCLDDFTMVDVVYSQTNFLKTDTYKSGNGWQREHAFCASLMTGYQTGDAVSISSSGTSRATDFHNLFASYGQGNGARGNKNFGVSDKDHLVPSSAPLADFTADTYNFEPNDCDKGQLARAIFYMGVMYNEEEQSDITIQIRYDGSKSKTLHVPAVYKPLTIQEEYVSFNPVTFQNFCLMNDDTANAVREQYMGSAAILDTSRINDSTYTDTFAKGYADYRYADSAFAIGNLSTLLDWNNYEVSRQEMQHNESVYSHVYEKRGVAQNNRNPFVDYPELVDYVYGLKKDQPGELKKLCPSEELLDTGSSDINNYAVTSYKTEYYVGDTFTKSDYSLLRVNKDFSTQEKDFTDTNPDYTFTDSDIGSKEMTIHTPINDIKYKVEVKANSGLVSCNYQHTLTGVAGDFINCNDTNKNYQYANKENPLTFANDNDTDPASIDWYGYWKNGRVAGYNVDNGVTFGAQSSTTTNDPCETLYFKTQSSLKVDAVYILGNTGSNKSYTLKIYCDSQVIYTDTFARQSAPTEYGIKLANPVTGQIKVEFTSVNGLVILKSIGVNVVD